MGLLRVLAGVCLVTLSAPACSQTRSVLPGMSCSTDPPGGSRSAIGHAGDFDYAVRARDGGDDWLGLIACTANLPVTQPARAAGTPDMPGVRAKDRILLLLSYSPDGAVLERARLEAPADFTLPPGMQKPESSYFLRSALQSVEGDDKGLLDSMTVQLGADPADVFTPIGLTYNPRTEKAAFARGEVDGGLTIDAADCAAPASKPFCDAIVRLAGTASTLHVEYRTRHGVTVMAGDIPVAGLAEALPAASAALSSLKTP